MEQALKYRWDSKEEMSEYRHCARHVQSNFTKVFNGQQLKLKMMTATTSTTVDRFKIEMDEIKKAD